MCPNDRGKMCSFALGTKGEREALPRQFIPVVVVCLFFFFALLVSKVQ